MAGVSFTGGGESEVNMSRRVSTSEDMSVSGKGPVQMAGKGADITDGNSTSDTTPSNYSDLDMPSSKNVVDFGEHDPL